MSKEEVEIPVRFGSGRVIPVGYERIKSSHSPNLVITEIAPLKIQAINLAQRLDKQTDGHKIGLIDMVVMDAAEALAQYGNYWPKEQEPLPDLEELAERYVASPVVLVEGSHIIEVLTNYTDGFRNESNLEAERRLGEALNRIRDISQRAIDKLVEQGKTPQSLMDEQFEKWLDSHPDVRESLESAKEDQ